MTILNFNSIMSGDGAPRHHDNQAKEKLFLEYYSWLVECALNITHGQRERAEDLVHDVFVQFLAKNTDIASISNVRGYLNGILCNLHLLQLRRSTRHPVQSLTPIDHDSALVGLRTWNSAEQLQSADLLFRACDFVCYRKEVATTSSILILRFFHGFYPGEICALLNAGRKAVDKWIVRGRSETKQYLESPYPLPETLRTTYTKPVSESSAAFLRNLRERIFQSCTSDCSVLADDARELGMRELAHLVSCRACLARRSRDAGLAHVAERMADDISDRDDGRPEGRTGGGGRIVPVRFRGKSSKRAVLHDVYARQKEVFEHRPKEISVVFDGVPRATLLVNAATNTLNVSLDSNELTNSVAVFSEQDFNFLLLDYDDLIGHERRVYGIPLSDDRFLEVTVTPGTLGACIQIVYLDPSFVAETCAVEEDRPRSCAVKQRALESPLRFGGGVFDRGSQSSTAFLGTLRAWIRAMNPLLTSAVTFGVAATICFFLWLRTIPSPSLVEVLDRAQRSDRAASAVTNRPGVIYEKVAIRTQHRTLERTIYRDAQGVRHPRLQKLSLEDEQLKNKLASAGVNWDAPLSAIDFADWRRRSGPTHDSVKPSGPHLLTVTTTPAAHNSVIQETLTVRDTDFQGVDRTVELREFGTVEIAQRNYDVLPWGAVNQDWFEPLPAGAATDAPGILSPRPSRPSAERDLETELAVRYALHRIGADLGEPIEIHSGGQGTAPILVVGVVSSAERKQELFAALQPLPGVATRLKTEEEAAPREVPAKVTRAEPLIVAAHSPIERELLNYFGDPAGVENFSKHSIALTRDLMAHAWALRHLSERFGAPGVTTEPALSPASHQLLETMVREHRRAMSQATLELVTLLRPVLAPMVQVSRDQAVRLAVFESAQQVQRLTMDLVFGPGSPNESEAAKTAKGLLSTLQRLESTLEEQL